MCADEVRNFVADLAHLAYSRGLPGGPSGTAPPEGHLPSEAPPPPLMHQTLMNVPLHLIPGHPNFDQHAYHLLVQQQHHEQQHQQLQQQQHFRAQEQQHGEEVADMNGEVKGLPDAQHALSPQDTLEQDADRQDSRIDSHLPTTADDTQT